MVYINGKFYSFHVLPKIPQVSEGFLHNVAIKYKAFRLKAISEPGSFAFGRTKFEVEQNWPLESYYDELNDAQNLFAITIETTSELTEHQAILEGSWIGIVTTYGPLPAGDWTLPSVDFGHFPEEVDRRYHGGNAHMLMAYRGLQSSSGKTLFTQMADVIEDCIIQDIRLQCPRLPAYYRMRATVSVPKLLEHWCARGYNLAGWIPQVTYSLVMHTRIKRWPRIEQDHEFYDDCKFAVVERMVKVERSSIEVLDPQRVKSSL